MAAGNRRMRANTRFVTIILDLFWDLFRPFYRDQQGQIFVLASPDSQVRDSLALALLARLFPLPNFQDVVVELSRPVKVGCNIILIGAAELFVTWNSERYRGPAPRVVGATLRNRLKRLAPHWCHRFSPDVPWAILNSVTGEKHKSCECGAGNDKVQVDWAVIRIAYKGPYDNTIIIEGIHGLGTLGACMAVTSPQSIRPVVEALRVLKKIQGYSNALPIEILIKIEYRPGLDGGQRTPHAITATPVKVIYNRDWAFDLIGNRRWINQKPPSMVILAQREVAPRVSGALHRDWEEIAPRLEIQLDLMDLPEIDREKLRSLLESCSKAAPSAQGLLGTSRSGDVEKLMSVIRSRSDQVRLELFEKTATGGSPHSHVLPDRLRGLKQIRKIYFVELLFGYIFSRRYPYDADSLSRNLSTLVDHCSHPLDKDKLESHFVQHVNGKMMLGFERLLRYTDGYSRKDYVAFKNSKPDHTYYIQLGQLTLLFKLRL